MKQLTLLTLLLLAPLAALAQKDMMLFRDGSEKMVKVIQVNNDRIIYKEKDKKKSPELSVLTTDVFMIKYENKMNVFFDEYGDRSERSKELKHNKKDILVYLKIGAEMPVYSLELKRDGYAIYKKKKKDVQEHAFYKSEICMVKDPDGTKDILSDYVSHKEEPVNLPTPAKTNRANDTRETSSPDNAQDNVEMSKPTPLHYPCKALVTKIDGTSIRATVYSADNKLVCYRKLSNPNGPLYKLERSQVKSITPIEE
jgi:hypothetical protein